MLLCFIRKTKQFLKNLFLYLNCFLTPTAFLSFSLFLFIVILIFYQYSFIILLSALIFIVFTIMVLTSGHFLHTHDISEDLKIFEDKLKNNFKDIVFGEISEVVALHKNVKKCNKPFEKKILKTDIILIGLSSTHFIISECTEFNLLKPKREDLKKFCDLIAKCDFKGSEEFYYTFVENVFYRDDRLFIVTSNMGSKVIECDEASAKEAVKAIRRRLREREDKRQYCYIKESV